MRTSIYFLFLIYILTSCSFIMDDSESFDKQLQGKNVSVFLKDITLSSEEEISLLSNCEYAYKKCKNLLEVDYRARIYYHFYPDSSYFLLTNYAHAFAVDTSSSLVYPAETSTLIHETLHIFAYQLFTLPSEETDMIIFFVEGLAVALANYPENSSDFIHFTGDFLEQNSIWDIINKNFIEFYKIPDNQTNYIVAGTFCHYLIASHGITKFKSFYSSMSWNISNTFQNIYDEDIEIFIDDWKNWVN